MAITTPKTRTYYGEYTLKHWIALILSGDIILPEYQRAFAWKEEKIDQFITSLREGDYVPPVTIAAGKEQTRDVNLILDGQQRLTSVLLAALGYMPIARNFPVDQALSEEGISDSYASDDEDEDIDKEATGSTTIAWSFRVMLGNIKGDRQELQRILARDPRYRQKEFLSGGGLEAFLENTYLGFLYIVPSDISTNSQQLFAKLFRSINYVGERLSREESRRALYYQDLTLTSYFEGQLEINNRKTDVLEGVLISDNAGGTKKIDWLRYLSILSQKSVKKEPLMGYLKEDSREDFYEDYIAYIRGLDQKDRRGKFDKFKDQDPYKDGVWKVRYRTLNHQVSRLRDKMGQFTSIIDADYWLFGLIYTVLFEGKILKDGAGEGLQKEIVDKISLAKGTKEHRKDPGRLKFLRQRLNESIDIYRKYVS
ncbi:DUF262 domain-containing protein [uncultured Porphyromonas sp.]|jgi:hypothetical protein|uniref:DUF262 domain-containing protein n=1 Tax=uncultured Porphyromonas sp. TaxID=159274 RepID=UPI0025E9934B|nr:DUF262 domain-containing protein [uncultured Porphyromonas sp.]